jgi:hypothetical protein
MKTNAFMLLSLLFLVCSSCKENVDVLKEQEAIKAVMEEEKNTFNNRNLEGIAATWIQKPSSIKIYMHKNGQTKLIGWDKIYEDDKEYLRTDTFDRKKFDIKFSDYQFNIYEKNAWVMFKAIWNIPQNDTTYIFEQTRISAFEKSDGKWKYTLMAIFNVPNE